MNASGLHWNAKARYGGGELSSFAGKILKVKPGG